MLRDSLQSLIYLCLINMIRSWSDLTPQAKQLLIQDFMDIDKNTETGPIDVVQSQLAYIEAEGYGELTITVTHGHNQDPKTLKCWVYGTKFCLLWNFDRLQYDENLPRTVKINARLYQMQEKTGIRIRLIGGELIEVPSQQRALFELNNITSLDILVKFTDIDTTLIREESKIQFFVFQGFGGRIDTDQFLKLHVSKGRDRVIPAKSNASSISTIGLGTVATYIPQDPDFCLETNCTYALRIDTMNIRTVELSTSVFGKVTDINLETSVFMVDQLRDNDVAYYKLIGDPSKTNTNWRIQLTPVEGDADIAIDGEKMSDDFKDYHWSSRVSSQEDILITNKEIKDLNLTGNLFYMRTNSTKASTFGITVIRHADDGNYSEPLNPNVPVTGEAGPREIINYVLYTDVHIPEMISWYATIKTVTGNPDLYVKSCNWSATSCMVTKEDIDNSSALERDSNLIFRSSKVNVGDDSVFINYNAIPDDKKYQNFTFSDPSTQNLYVCKACKFAIAVVGNPSSSGDTSKYVLEVKGAKTHHSLVLGEAASFRVDQKRAMYYKIDLDEVKTDAVSSVGFLNYKMIVLSGDADIYFSRTYPYPDSENNDRSITIDNNNQQMYSQTRYIPFEGNSAKLNGRHYMAIHARQFLFGSVVVTQDTFDLGQKKSEAQREIKFGETVYSSLPAISTKNDSFYFNIDIPQSQQEVQLILQLNPVEGMFKFCVSTKVSDIKSWEDCTWTDVAEHGNIIINQDDPNFRRNLTYGVLVAPIVDDNLTFDTNFAYNLVLSSQDTFINLIEGLAYKISVLSSPRLFRIEVFPESTSGSIALSLTTLDKGAVLEASFDKADIFANTTGEKIRTSTGQYASIYYSLPMIADGCNQANYGGGQRSCYLYIRLSPSLKMPFEYSLLAFSINKPVYISESSAASLPSPLGHDLELEYVPTTSKGVDINVYSETYELEVVVKVTEVSMSATQPKIETFVSNDIGTNIIHVPADILKNYFSPNIKITLINKDVEREAMKVNHDEFDYTKRVTVQVSTSLRTLNHLVPIEELAALPGIFKYFKFTKPLATEAMIYLHVLTGEAGIFARHLEEGYPDSDTYEYRSTTFKSEELMLPVNLKANSTGNKFETYIIGVLATERSSYQLMASKNSSFSYFHIVPGTILSKTFKNRKPFIVSYYNRNNSNFTVGVMGLNTEVKVTYRTVKDAPNTSFLEELPSFNDPSFTSKKSPYFNRFDINPTGTESSRRYLFRIEAEEDDLINIFVGPIDSELYLKAGTTIGDVVLEKKCQSYMITFDSEVLDEKVRLDMHTGTVDVTIAEITSKTDYTTSYNNIVAPTQKEYSLKDIVNGGKTGSSKVPQHEIFKAVQVNICAKSNAASYQLTASKPDHYLKPIVPGVRFGLNHVGSDNDTNNQAFYYMVSPSFVQSLKIRINLKGISVKDASYQSALEYVLQSVSFGYLTNEDFNWGNETIQANIKAKTFYGSMAEIELDVMKGILIITDERYKDALRSSDGEDITMQLVVNNMQLLSSLGHNTQVILPKKFTAFQIVKPGNSTLDLVVSSCSGVMKVDVYDFSGQKPNLTMYFYVGRNRSNPSLDPNDFYSQTIKFEVTSESVILNITNLDDSESQVSISSDIRYSDERLTLDDYFDGIATTNRELKDELIQIFQQPNNDTENMILISNIKPANGFEKRYPQFKAAEIELELYITSQPHLLVEQTSLCPMKFQDVGSDIKTKKKTFNITKKNGVFDWPARLFDTFEYPEASLMTVFIQLKITFLGDNDEATDDDAVIVLKKLRIHTQELSNSIAKVFGIFVLLVLFGALVIGAAVYLFRLQNLPPPGHQRVNLEMVPTSFDEAAQSNRIETIENKDNNKLDETVAI